MQGSFKSLRNLKKQKLRASRKENQNHRTGKKLKEGGMYVNFNDGDYRNPGNRNRGVCRSIKTARQVVEV
jgi:hypothetical protein